MDIISLLKAQDEQGLHLLETEYGAYIKYIIQSILYDFPEDSEECYNDVLMKCCHRQISKINFRPKERSTRKRAVNTKVRFSRQNRYNSGLEFIIQQRLPQTTATTSQLKQQPDFQEILNELPDSELEYYTKPIKNIEVQSLNDNEMLCDLFITEFEPENNVTSIRLLYRIRYKNPSLLHKLHTNGYIALESGAWQHVLPDTVNVFYCQNGIPYRSDRISSGFIGGEVPERYEDSCFYLGFSQNLTELLPDNHCIYYFKRTLPYAYPFEPAGTRAKFGPNISKCFFYTLRGGN